MEAFNIISIADRHIGAQYPFNFRCVSFVCMIYHEAGLSICFSKQPVITSYKELSDLKNIGKIIFLLRKGSTAYLYSHVALIYNNESVIHYSRYMNTEMVRRVEINSFKELLEVYDLVPNPYVSNPQKVKLPYL